MATVNYETLLTEVLPSRIGDDEEYARIGARLGDLVGKGNRRTPDETKLMELLMVLVADYDQRHGLPPGNLTPAEMLTFLMEESGRPQSDLLPVFGQRSHVNEAINGKRPISADHARKLGVLFNVNPGLFL